jgi:DNA (cytosine-5)-methyltransferase 1
MHLAFAACARPSRRGQSCRVRSTYPTVLSLYSGAGGLDLGFVEAGFEIVWANEVDHHACETYRANLGDHIIEGDLLAVPLPSDPVDVVIGGPPCQGWSRIGRMDPKDSRSEHVHLFMDVVAAKSPAAFVLENVAHLAESPRWKKVRDQLLKRARRELGYYARIFVLDASHFGVAQSRRRMFLVGLRDSRPVAPRRTTASHPKTVRQVLTELPPLGARGNRTRCAARIVPAKVPVMRHSAFQGALLFNGSGRPLDLDRPARTLPASMGGNATPIIDQLEADQAASPWVVGYHRHLSKGGEPFDRAPARLRRLTVEEAAALQSFPSTFRFRGPVGARYRQIGNAVPPRLSRAVARAVRRTMLR